MFKRRVRSLAIVLAINAVALTIPVARAGTALARQQSLTVREDAALMAAFRGIAHRFVELSAVRENAYMRRPEDLQAFWRRFASSPPPAVDFNRYDVVVVLMGTKGSGGYLVRILAAMSQGGRLRLQVLSCSPGPGSLLIAEVTSPFDVKVVDKTSGPVTFDIEEGRTGQGTCR